MDGKPNPHTHTKPKNKDTTYYAAWKFCQWGTRQNAGKFAGCSRGETIRYCSQWSFMLPGGKYLFSMSARRGFTPTPFLWVCFLFSFLGKTSFDQEITSCILLAYGSISCPAKQRLTSSDWLRRSSLTSGKVSAQLAKDCAKTENIRSDIMIPYCLDWVFQEPQIYGRWRVPFSSSLRKLLEATAAWMSLATEKSDRK